MTAFSTGLRLVPENPGLNGERAFTGSPQNVPSGWLVAGGAPDHDLLALLPCGHILEGEGAHAYQLAALNLTYPDVHIYMRLVIPAGHSGSAQPSIMEVDSVQNADEMAAAHKSLALAVLREVRRMGDQLVQAVPRPVESVL